MVSLNPYSLIVKLRNRAYDRQMIVSKKLPGKVISVGNIVAGGTGKTPVVCRLASYLKAQGHRPAILTRGYRSGMSSSDSGLLLNGMWNASMTPSGDIHADEAMMQSQMLPGIPVIVGAKRWRAAQRFLKLGTYQPTHWILDDGFQHRKLQRDLDIVLLDSRDPFGGGHLLPRGRLREPVANLARANVVCFTRSDAQHPNPQDIATARRHAPQIVFVPFQIGNPKLVVGESGQRLQGAKVAVVAGIANPDRFIREVVASGATITSRYIVSDHARFSPSAIAEKSLVVDAVVTTPKDYWREPAVFAGSTKPVFVLPINAEWSDTSIAEVLQRFGL